MSTPSPLADRRILVTGASSGIGLATARAARAAGARVALLARRAEVLAGLAAELDAVAVPADVTDPQATREAVDHAADKLGGLDAVVNAAGVLRPGLVAETDPADWRIMMEVNLLGVLQVTHAAIPHLRASSAARDIVTVSSMSGRRLGSPGMGVYAASKAAVHMACEGLRRELGPEGIRVSVIAPGFVDTPMFQGDSAEVDRLRRAAREVGLPAEDVAAGIVHVLGAPAHLMHAEVAMLSVAQLG